MRRIDRELLRRRLDGQLADYRFQTHLMPINNRDGSDGFNPTRPVLTVDRVRYVGDTVAVVIAETAAQARDAAELVTIDYADLEPVVDLASAIVHTVERWGVEDMSGLVSQG